MNTTEFKSATREEQMEALAPLFDIASKMLLAGTLKKNVVRFFTNKGLPIETATNIMEVAEVKAEKFSKTKFK